MHLVRVSVIMACGEYAVIDHQAYFHYDWVAIATVILQLTAQHSIYSRRAYKGRYKVDPLARSIFLLFRIANGRR